jgi:glutamine---fructose-6-phosphate transaminase (isomerizing)
MSHPYQSYYEITCQKAAWQETVDVISDAMQCIKAFFDRTQPSQIIFAGCTSPLYIGESVAPSWQASLGIPVRAVPCSELIQFSDSYYTNLPGKPVMVVISRSGKTSETLWAVEAFQRKFPGRVFGICCAPESPLTKMLDQAVYLPKGHEQTLAQTSSFSSMLLAAQMIGAGLTGNTQALKILQSAPNMCETIISRVEPIICEILIDKTYQNLFYFGAGPTTGIARDAQLKMMEMSLSETMCFTFLESRHGPRSLINEGSLAIGLCTRGGLGFEANLIDEYTQKQGATTVAITPTADWHAGKPTFSIPVGCDWPDELLGLAYSPVMQLMAYYRAISKGVNPDTSRHLTQFTAIKGV